MADVLAPGFLIAVPQLLDGNFHRTVVFLIEHNAEGAFGVVVNRPSKMNVSELLETLNLSYRGQPDAKVLVGGPVQPDRGLVLHMEGNSPGDSRAVTESIFMCSSTQALKRLFEQPGRRVLCFAGYSGWGPGQLEREIDEGSWIPAPPDDVLIFDTNREAVWETSLRQLGIDPALLVRGESDGPS
jgi:putative transcriptional regulator